MANNWKNEPVLKFGFMTIRATISEVGEENGEKGEPTYSESIFFDYGGDPFRYWPYALKWYKKATLQKEPLAEQILKQIEEFKNTERKARKGDANAQYLLSCFYHETYGTGTNMNLSSEWLRQAALNGNEDAIKSIEDWNRFNGSGQKMSDPDFYSEPEFLPDDYEFIFLGGRHGWVKEENRADAKVDKIWETFSNLDFEKR